MVLAGPSPSLRNPTTGLVGGISGGTGRGNGRTIVLMEGPESGPPLSTLTGTTGNYDCVEPCLWSRRIGGRLRRKPPVAGGLVCSVSPPPMTRLWSWGRYRETDETFHSHGTRKAGITVAEEESDETKKYAVDGIPREYKNGRFTREKAVSPSPTPYLLCSPHVSDRSAHVRKRTKC